VSNEPTNQPPTSLDDDNDDPPPELHHHAQRRSSQTRSFSSFSSAEIDGVSRMLVNVSSRRSNSYATCSVICNGPCQHQEWTPP
jgi:hypothetical protein